MALSEYLSAMGSVQPGMPLREAVSSQRLNAIIGAIRALANGENISGGPGLLVSRNAGAGITLRSTARSQAGGGSAITHPFQIRNTSIGGDDPVAKINVRYGTVMDIAPTGIDTDITVGDGIHTVYLDVEIDLAGTAIAATLSVEEGPQPADDEYHGYIVLGEVVVESGAVTTINQAATHSLRMAMCGRQVDGETLVNTGTYEFWGF